MELYTDERICIEVMEKDRRDMRERLIRQYILKRNHIFDWL